MKDPEIVIVNFGGQLAPLIERSLREIGYRSAFLSPKQAEKWIQRNKPKAIIMSGSQHSVNAKDYPMLAPWVFETGIPMLGICYGMQLITKFFGGKVASGTADKQYGVAVVRFLPPVPELFSGVPTGINALVSHGDTVMRVPTNFVIVGESETGAIAAIHSQALAIWGVQFHPESLQTPFGKQILGNFVGSIAGCEKDWHPKEMVAEIRCELAEQIGSDRACLAYSGGVDSSTLAALAAPVLRGQLKGVCLDAGQLRLNEAAEIQANALRVGLSLQVEGVEDKFFEKFNFTDLVSESYCPEMKRRVFSSLYAQCLEDAASKLQPKFFLQGTLAPDMIESGETGGAVIKSHHNVGVKLKCCESLHPFKHLFKYEVRALARELGLPEFIVERQPFPGPGLFIRLVGMYPTPKLTEILCWADNEVVTLAREQGIYKQTSQLLVGLSPPLCVGVKGDERVYGHCAMIRAVVTTDFMTATGYRFPFSFQEKIEPILVSHPAITQVGYYPVGKPPATIEFE